MVFKNKVKNIQAAVYYGGDTVIKKRGTLGIMNCLGWSIRFSHGFIKDGLASRQVELEPAQLFHSFSF